ncbi:MAG: hypothetical protein Q9195_009455 [Heterodermia aff. obscurata]
MWPIGYIIESAYSPLHLERETSDRNWRDAFEDLLALDAGRDMIHPANRKAEDDKAAETRYKYANDFLQTSNMMQRERLKFQAFQMKTRQALVEDGQTKQVAALDHRILAFIKSEIETKAAEAQAVKTAFEAHRDAKASRLKSAGLWMTSLITNGAAPGWSSFTSNSVGGPVVSFRRDEPPELAVDMSFSESELEAILEKREYQLGVPYALPSRLVDHVTNGEARRTTGRLAVGLIKRYLPSPSSILTQYAYAEPIRLRDGSIGAKAIIKNQLAGREEEVKEFVEEPSKVFEEMVIARCSMATVGETVVERMQGPKTSVQEEMDAFMEARDD